MKTCFSIVCHYEFDIFSIYLHKSEKFSCNLGLLCDSLFEFLFNLLFPFKLVLVKFMMNIFWTLSAPIDWKLHKAIEKLLCLNITGMVFYIFTIITLKLCNLSSFYFFGMSVNLVTICSKMEKKFNISCIIIYHQFLTHQFGNFLWYWLCQKHIFPTWQTSPMDSLTCLRHFSIF